MTIAGSRVLASTSRDDLATLFGRGVPSSRTDGELLARFQSGQGDEASGAAFGAIVARHGPLVLGACRRILRDGHDAADAFQATFLVLARKAPAYLAEDSLGPWIHGVAVRVARRARSNRLAERSRVVGVEGLDPVDAGPRADPELRASIDEEISRLPEHYRAAAVLCYLQGLTQAEAARRLRCPVGTVESRLHRARARLRAGLARRGFAPSAILGGLDGLATTAEVPAGLVATASASASKLAGGVALARSATSAVVALSRGSARGAIVGKASWAAALAVAGMAASGALAFGRGGKGAAVERGASPAPIALVAPDEPARKDGPTPADRLAKILAEYEAKSEELRKALEGATGQSEINAVYRKMSPDEVAFCRRMIDLAMAAPRDPASRSALVWVVNKPNMQDAGPYGDEFARAAALLLRQFGDDPEAVRVGIGMDNIVSAHRDALLTGFVASARSRESKGLARLALAQYLESRAKFAASALMARGRQKHRFLGMIGDDGKPYDKEIDQTDEEYAYQMLLRQSDPAAIRAEFERLYAEVIADYGDVPLITVQHRKLEALLKGPTPSWNGKPLTKDELEKLRAMVANKKTLADAARARLDEMANLVEGKPAPAIEGPDIHGKPLRLADYRGKVVVLVFWGSWCGPCMREVPHERELAERLKGRPFALLGVDCNEEKAAGLKAMEAERMTWPSWNDGDRDGPIVSRYHVRSYPTMFVIDPNGVIRARGHLGGAILDKVVDDLLKEFEGAKTAGAK